MDRYRRQVREFAAGVGYRGRNLCVDSDFANVLAAEMRELRVDPETSGEVAEVRRYLERRRRFWQNMGWSICTVFLNIFVQCTFTIQCTMRTLSS